VLRVSPLAWFPLHPRTSNQHLDLVTTTTNSTYCDPLFLDLIAARNLVWMSLSTRYDIRWTTYYLAVRSLPSTSIVIATFLTQHVIASVADKIWRNCNKRPFHFHYDNLQTYWFRQEKGLRMQTVQGGKSVQESDTETGLSPSHEAL